ncbi:ribonuclease CAF1 [Halteromyces radiatus]|uniref:ribonuclease CAF1 n=1 Tax=Halteromyces radiatus TaxID=101107 RepID=UPI00221F82AB|nr:ribonuclease CAF1 [Halteromyces radiatus]KAI8081637.1 ribonuclease CAF1 [Halteromyces radiatus]
MAYKNTIPMAFTEVTSENVLGLTEPILKAIGQAQYIALDTEFSGHCPTITKHMEQRYQAISKIIRTHTLFSFGLTIISKQQQDETQYQFTNLEFLTRNQRTFEVDPNNIKFLAENGLDFGRVFQYGIPFVGGNSSTNDSNIDNATKVIRHLWYRILQIIRENSIPIVVHNGLLDIMYLYQSFFASLPENWSSFVADLVEMFPAGVYDTKYLSTSVVGESKSFLAYLYCKYHRQQQEQQQKNRDQSWSVQVLPPLMSISSSSHSSPIENSPLCTTSTESVVNTDGSNRHDSTDSPASKRRKRARKMTSKKESKTGICGPYSQHGWCKYGKDCPLSHDLTLILDYDLGIQMDNKNKDNDDDSKIDKNGPDLLGNSLDDNTDVKPLSATSATTTQTNKDNDNQDVMSSSMQEWTPRRDHSAHFDAYMTAFIFCHFLSTLPADELPTHINKVNLMRLDIPLRLVQSHYAKPSLEWTRLKSELWPSSLE